jgi:hypothetical protein
MAFNFGSKLQVLESKLDIYEDLSKQMLDKLERAVASISESSNKVAIVLERHENRLDESEKSDALILRLFEEFKAENRKQHNEVSSKIGELENKINDFAKFRWVTVGIAIAAVTIIQAPRIFGHVLTGPKVSANMNEVISFVHASH